jgi:hypothetical protein
MEDKIANERAYESGAREIIESLRSDIREKLFPL